MFILSTSIGYADGVWWEGIPDFVLNITANYSNGILITGGTANTMDDIKMLTNQEQMSDGSFHKGSRPCESGDIRAYNLCGADIYLEQQARKAQEVERKRGNVEEDFSKIKKWFLGEVEKAVSVAPAE